MSNPSALPPGGPEAPRSNPFKNEDETAKLILGIVQVLTFAVAICILALVMAPNF